MPTIDIKNIRILIDFGSAIKSFKKDGLESLASIDHELSETIDWINKRVIYWQNKTTQARLHTEKIRAQIKIQLQQKRDKGDSSQSANLTSQKNSLEEALRQQKYYEDKLHKAIVWRDRLTKAINEFVKEENRYKNVLYHHTQNALIRLGIIISKYQAIYHYSLETHSPDRLVSYSEFDRKNLSKNILATEGQHGAMFEMAKKAFKLQSIEDPNAPRYIKGWLLQEKNNFSRFGYIRNPPGFQVGHRIKGVDDPKKFGWENADMNQFRGGKYKR